MLWKCKYSGWVPDQALYGRYKSASLIGGQPPNAPFLGGQPPNPRDILTKKKYLESEQ